MKHTNKAKQEHSRRKLCYCSFCLIAHDSNSCLSLLKVKCVDDLSVKLSSDLNFPNISERINSWLYNSNRSSLYNCHLFIFSLSLPAHLDTIDLSAVDAIFSSVAAAVAVFALAVAVFTQTNRTKKK